MSSEARVGAIVLIIIVALGGTILFMGRFRQTGYTLAVYFDDAHGLQPNAEVKMLGLPVGRIRAIDIVPNAEFMGKPVKVTVELTKGLNIRDTDVFAVDQEEFPGSRFVSIHPFQTKFSKVLPKKGGETGNTGAAGFAGLPVQTAAVLEDMHAIVHDLRGFLTDRGNKEQIRGILANINAATRSASLMAQQGVRFAASLAHIASANDQRVASLVENLRLASGNVMRTTDEIHKIVALTPLPADMARAGQEMRGAAQDIHATTTAARDFMADPALRKQFDEMVANLRQSTESLTTLTNKAAQLVGDDKLQGDMRQTMANMRDASANIKQATDNARKLLDDPQVADDLKAAVHGARLVTERGAEVANKASKSLDRVDRTMDSLGGAVASIRPKSVDAWFNAEAARHIGFRGDFNVDLRYTNNPNDYWRVGVGDIGGESEGLILQKSLPIGSSARFRAGLLYGKLSLGYDRLWRNSGLEFDLYDPNNLTLDVRGTHRIADDWDLMFGVDQAFNRNYPFIGVRRWMNEPETPNK